MIKVGVVGASGYTGVELVRLLLGHPKAEITTLVADSNAGQPLANIYPHLCNTNMLELPDLIAFDEVDWSKLEIVFFALPHGVSQGYIPNVPDAIKVIDLSADFRLSNVTHYEEWYGKPHMAEELQGDAVYGLSEHYSDNIKAARLVACPGCYPTSILLPLIPLLEQSHINPHSIIADSKSGISGAGRTVKASNLFTEINDNVFAYGIGGHRHIAEIEQELSKVADVDLTISFTPHVVPMNRGILSLIHVELVDGESALDLKSTLSDYYNASAFVHVIEGERVPSTREVSGTNKCVINVFADRLQGRALIISVIDNLLKGASGQAVQNFNIMQGFDESEGLNQLSVFP